MADYFWGYINVIAFHVVFDIVVEGYPIVFLGQKFISLLNAKIASPKIIVIVAN